MAAIAANFIPGIGPFVSAGIAIGGNLLINAFLPAAAPRAQAQAGSEISPTYTLSAQGNQARLGGVIPVFARPRRFTHFERAVNVRVPAHDASAPARVVLGSSATAATNTDLATATWTLRRVGSTGDYRAKWTVRAQKLCRDGGSGRYMAAGDPVTVAARTVTDLAMTTVRQQIRLPERGLWRLEVTGHEDSVNAAVTLIRITGDNVHAFSEFTYTAEEVSGSGIELNLGGSASGPFPACPPHRTVRRIAVDYIAPGGIWYHQREQSTLSNTQVTTRVEVRRIDDRGRPLEQRFTSLGSRRTWGHAASSLAQNARRWTEVYELPARARYEVRVTYVGFDTRGASILARGDRLTWAGLRGYHLQATRRRRRFITFDTELEGALVNAGSAAVVAHGIPRWGQASRVEAFDPGTLTFETEDAVDLAGGNAMANLRGTANVPSAPIGVEQIGPRTFRLAALPEDGQGNAFDIRASGQGGEPTHVLFGANDNTPQTVLVLGVKPGNDGRVSVTCVLDDPGVHVN